MERVYREEGGKKDSVWESEKKKTYVCGMEMKDMQMDEWVARPFLKCLMALIYSGERGRETYSGQTISRRESDR